MNRNLVGAVALVMVGFLLGSQTRSRGDDGESKDEKIRRYLKLSGEPADASKMCREEIKKNTTLSPEFVKRFNAAADENAFAEMLAPIYSKHFNEGDIDALIVFYESPVGRKLAKRRIKLQTDSMEAGRAWGMKMGLKIATELQSKPNGDDDDDKDEEKPAPPKKEEPKKEPKKDEPKEAPRKAPSKDEDF